MKRIIRALLVCLLAGCMLFGGVAEEETPVCTALYAAKGDGMVNFEASIVRCSPLDSYTCISVCVSYPGATNYEITAIHVYINDEPVQQLNQLSQNAFYGIFQIDGEQLNHLKIVPVATTAYAVEIITEELPASAMELSDFKKIGGAAE